jgi:hypothetical protein
MDARGDDRLAAIPTRSMTLRRARAARRLAPRMKRARVLLRRHGASRAQRAAFEGDGQFPDLREPARDPVGDVLLPVARQSPAEGGTRTPSAR